MKKILLISAFSFFIYNAQSQDITIFDNQNNNLIGDTLIFDNSIDTSLTFLSFEEKGFANVINNSTRQITVGLKRHEISVVPGTGDAVCWGSTCFGEKPAGTETTWDVDDQAVVAPGDTAAGLMGFVVYHYPNKQFGTSLYRYEFYDRQDETISSSVFILFRSNVLNADDLLMVDENRNYLNRDTINFSFGLNNNTPDTVYEQVISLNVFNNRFASSSWKFSRIETSVVTGTADSICWMNICTPLLESGSSQSIEFSNMLNLGEVELSDSAAQNFIFYHKPNNNVGNSYYEFKFEDQADPSNTNSFFIKVNTSYVTGLSKFEKKELNLSLFPNPVSNVLKVNFESSMNYANQDVIVYDLLGKVIHKTRINQGAEQINMNLTALNSGIYFLSIQVDGEIIKTKKLIKQ